MTRLVLKVLHLYREFRGLRPAACRYQPTCSAYAVEAVEQHGVARGLGFAVRRVLRCHPFGSHGHDPVPPSVHRLTTSSHV